ncbi:hypothetical protein, partial [Streptomyces sp. SID13726]|uniref:hypothetical protein n=1 Tax=Streptomyces sp. SID13726 TaxID=2706058 RepID=UPI0013BD0872
RNAAARRLIAARSEAPGEKPVKVNSAQVASQVMPAGSKRVYKPPTRRGIRTKGDTKFHPAARVLASESKRQSIEAGRREEQS